MKKLFTLVMIAFIAMGAIAQVPQKMSYQAVVRNAENKLVVNQEIGLRISILQGGADGSEVFSEVHTVSTNANGLFTVQIGAGESTDRLATIDWAGESYFVKTEVDPEGGTNYTITGVSQLLAVPYALHAETASTVENVTMDGTATAFEGWDKNAADDFDGDYNNLSNKPDLSTIDTKLTDSEIATMGYVKTDAYSKNESDAKYLTSFTEVDGDASNEIQDLKLEGNVLTITNNGTATAIDLSKYLDNTNTQLSEAQVDEMVSNNGYLTSFTEVDGDASNEIQDLKLEGNVLTITNNGTATAIDLSKYLDDTNTQLSEAQVDEMVANNGYLTSFTEVDGDASNEIQDLKLEGNVLTITNNGTATAIDLSKYLDNTNTQLNETQVDAFVNNNGYAVDADLHVIAKSGNYADIENTPVLWDSTYTSIKGVPTNVSTFTNDAGYQLAADDEDISATNEIQTISRDGLTVTLTNGGTFTDSVLTETEVDAFVANNGYAADANLHSVAKSGDYSDLENKPELNIYAQKTALNDSLSAIRDDMFNGDMQNNKISNVANPVNAQDAATKAYVDELENAVKALLSWYEEKENNALLNTGDAADIFSGGATLYGSVVSNGGSAVTAYGFVYSTSSGPTIAVNEGITNDGSGLGNYSSPITGLEPLTTYYVRSYATNASGTSYGSEISFTTTAPAVGDYCMGGVVFYIFKEGDNGYVLGETHGLILSMNEFRVKWFQSNTFVSGTSREIGSGIANTSLIIAALDAIATEDYAAKTADNLVENGYSDWYLPSQHEADVFVQNKVTLNVTIAASGGTEIGNAYPSSSDWSASLPMLIYGGSDGKNPNYAFGKTAAVPCRAIRSF